jgi:hypothetical protein
MIRGIHGLLYSSDPEATRRFFQQSVKLPGSDVGDAWCDAPLGKSAASRPPAPELAGT